MHSVVSWRRGQAAVAAALLLPLLLSWLIATAMPAAAFDLFARHQVTVEFATADGKPMANAEVKVFAPGQSSQPATTGRTDGNGKFEFAADTDGFWRAEAHVNDEIARVSIRVSDTPPKQWVSPEWMLAGLFLLLILAFAYRVMRARQFRRKKG